MSAFFGQTVDVADRNNILARVHLLYSIIGETFKSRVDVGLDSGTVC